MGTPRALTDSPLAFATQAPAVAAALPRYGSARPRHAYALPEHAAAPAAKQFLGTDYRGPAATPADRAEPRPALGLTEVPRFTTPPKARGRLGWSTPTPP